MTCLTCGKQLNKNATKYCSKKCEKEFQLCTYIEQWKEGKHTGTIGIKKPVPSKYIQTYFKKQQQICSECKIEQWNNQPLTMEIDHINGNRYDNSIQNLRLLCPNCHSQTNTFRNKKRTPSAPDKRQVVGSNPTWGTT